MWTQQEQEWHAHQAPAELVDGQYTTPANDIAHRIHHYDNEQVWTVDAYDRRMIAAMREAGAVEMPSQIDGVLFRVDAKQLIQYIADTSGLIVEFRTRRRQQLSDEQRELRRQRMAAMNAQKQASFTT